MSKTSKTLKKMCALAGISVLAATASALPLDTAHIMIDRALNSPTLTIRYDGANAALVELRVNGESLGTRTVSASKTTGETNFNINLSELKDGDNEVEVRLYDRTGKLVGSDKSNISTDQSNYGPVFLKTPKVGATVMGNVEINMGFGRELKNVYVSFFVDSNFKKMTNYPPYSMVWDTIGETNGWHEIEAWAIDESSTTFKTRKTRVFVNNPGGRSDRQGVNVDLTPMKSTIRGSVEGNGSSALRSIDVKSTSTAVGAQSTQLAPKGTGGVTVANAVRPQVSGDLHGLKASPVGSTASTGVRSMTPTGTRVAIASSTKISVQSKSVNLKQATGEIHIAPHVAISTPSANFVATTTAPKQAGAVVRGVASAANLIRITRGQRLPNLTSFEVILNSAIVEFPDVQPRVDDGIPMTPLRYLLEKGGGKVEWENLTKTVNAKAEGREISLQIGDRNARVDKLTVSMETAPYIDRGRTIVPLSFIHDALQVTVDYDKETGHVLISSDK